MSLEEARKRRVFTCDKSMRISRVYSKLPKSLKGRVLKMREWSGGTSYAYGAINIFIKKPGWKVVLEK